MPKTDEAPHRLCASMALAEDLLDFTPKVSLIAGLARMVRSLNGPGEPELAALAPVGRTS
jgi:hypothetical protein